MAEYTMVVLSDAKDGREDDYNSWYDNQHIGDVLNVPGFKSAQRYKLADPSANAPRYMAVYDIDTDDVGGVMQELMARITDGRIPMTDAFAPGPAPAVYVKLKK